MDIHEEIKKLIVKNRNLDITNLPNEDEVDEEVNDFVNNIVDSLEYEVCKALANVYNAYYDELSTNGINNIDDDAFYGGIITSIIDEMSEILVNYWI
tara:strand:+ start:1495 stop:1785 length:291 start_codon:yes stop_codon:yes gene_type:complete